MPNVAHPVIAWKFVKFLKWFCGAECKRISTVDTVWMHVFSPPRVFTVNSMKTLECCNWVRIECLSYYSHGNGNVYICYFYSPYTSILDLK